LQRPCDRLAAEHWQLGALVTGHAPCPVCGAHCTSVAQLPVTVTRQCSRGRPRTCRSPRVSRDAECTRSTATGCKRTPCGAVTSIRSHDVQIGTARTRHWRRLSRSEAEQPPLRRHIPCASHEETHGLQAHQPARIGRQRPPCAPSRVRASLGAIRNMPGSAIPFGAHSRSIARWTDEVGCDG